MRERKHPLPTPQQLRDWLDYDPETGELRWKKRAESSFSIRNRGDRPLSSPQTSYAAWWNGRFAGQLAFTGSNKGGYLQSRVGAVILAAHRAIWAWMTNEWPPPGAEIDHRDGNKRNNKFSNLRIVTRAQQMQNQIRPQRKTLPRGVRRRKQAGGEVYSVRIKVNGTCIYLGTFYTPEEAHAAYLKAAAALHGEHAFHQSRGRLRA